MLSDPGHNHLPNLAKCLLATAGTGRGPVGPHVALWLTFPAQLSMLLEVGRLHSLLMLTVVGHLVTRGRSNMHLSSHHFSFLGLWSTSPIYHKVFFFFFSSEPRLDFISLSTALWEAIPRELSQAVVQPLSRV